MNNFNVHEIIVSPGPQKDWKVIQERIELVKPFSKTIHIDILDGKFAPNTTFLDPAPFKKYSEELFLEVHLMVEEPIQYLKPFADVGFKRFLGHVEKMSDQEEFVAEGQILGEVGLALDLETPLESIKVSFEDLDSVLLMCVNAGRSNQEFQSSALEKVKILKQVQNDNSGEFSIEVDGGINDQTLPQCKNAGANLFVSTSYISGSENPSDQYKKLQNLLQG